MSPGRRTVKSTSTNQLSASSVVVASRAQTSASLGTDEVVILNLSDNQYYGLTEAGVLIWDKLASPCTVASLADMIFADYGVSREQAEADVTKLLLEMIRRGLVELR